MKRFFAGLAAVALSGFLIGTMGVETPTPSRSPVPNISGAPIDSAPSNPKTNPSSGIGVKEAPTDPAARAALAQEAPSPSEKEGYRPVTFQELSSFPYETNDSGALLPGMKLPEKIAALNKRQVSVSGFLVPIEFDGQKVTSLILVRNQLLCCYGEEPKLNEWVFVDIDPPVEAITDVPVTLFGEFYADPDREGEQVISLYRMRATEMEKMES